MLFSCIGTCLEMHTYINCIERNASPLCNKSFINQPNCWVVHTSVYGKQLCFLAANATYYFNWCPDSNFFSPLFFTFLAYNHHLTCRAGNTKHTNAGVIHLFVILHMLIDVMRNNALHKCWHTYHNKVFCGHIIVQTTTCIQRCCFVQKQSVGQDVSWW